MEYLKKHQIVELLQTLTTMLVLERPGSVTNADEPRKFIQKHLRTKCLFTRQDVAAIVKCFTEREFLTLEQYTCGKHALTSHEDYWRDCI
jgi:hypothetical protein